MRILAFTKIYNPYRSFNIVKHRSKSESLFQKKGNTEMSNEVNISVFEPDVVLQPGEVKGFFANGRNPNRMRFFTVVPIFPPRDQPQPEFNPTVRISRVFELLFGAQAPANEVGNLQVNVEVENLNTGPGQVVHCKILLAETDN